MFAMNPFAKGKLFIEPVDGFATEEAATLHLVQLGWEGRKPGYREGVVLVPVDENYLIYFNATSAHLAHVNPKWVTFDYAPRKGVEEAPRKQLYIKKGELWEPREAWLICYSSQLLAEDGHNCLEPIEGNWEIIGVTDGAPMQPETLMYNHFHQPGDGGTNTHMTDSEFVAALKESHEYWKSRIPVR